ETEDVGVIAGPADERIVTSAADQLIVASAAVQRVVFLTADQSIASVASQDGCSIAVQNIVAVLTVHDVYTACADDRVVAGARDVDVHGSDERGSALGHSHAD